VTATFRTAVAALVAALSLTITTGVPVAVAQADKQAGNIEAKKKVRNAQAVDSYVP
jgi:hypothetical protein